MAAQIGLPETRYPDDASRAALFDRILPRTRALPGVTSAAIVSALPLRGETWVDILSKEGDNRPFFERPSANIRSTGPEYFKTMGIPILQGREFEDRDRNRPVMVLSARAAAKLWPGEDPIGKKLRRRPNDPFSEVVGIAGEVRAEIDKDAPVMGYVPYWQRARSQGYLVVRTGMDPRAAVEAVRREVWKEDAELPVPEMTLLSEVVSTAAAGRRFHLWLVGVFASAALALACLGIYGVVAHAVARRTNELGIRMALGARGVDVLAMVLRQGLTPVAAGLAVGVAASLAIARLLRSLLFQVSATDPRVIAAAVVVLAAVAAAACLLPARRASRVDPIVALRYE
jgi:putative ABC transport system permease protein